MSPARAAPGWSPPRAVLAGRDAPARVRARAALRGTRQALVEAEVGFASGPRAVGGRVVLARGRLGPKLVQGGLPLRLPRVRLELPLRLPRGRPATPPRPSQVARAVKARMYRGKPSKRNAAAGGRPIGKKALQRLEELPDRAKYQRALRRRRAASTYRENRQPQRRA